MVLEKTLEILLDSKEIKPVYSKWNQHWIFIGRTDAEVEAPILWPPDAKSWLTGKDPYAEKDCKQEKGTTEDEMVGWHHRLKGHDFKLTLGDSEGQRSLACCSLGVSKSQTRLSNWTAVCYCWGFPGGSVVKEPACQCRRHKRCGFSPWVGKIPWRRARHPTPLFLPGKSHGQRSLMG